MVFMKCTVCGHLIVSATADELEEARRHHLELDQAAIDSLKRLFPGWVEKDGICEQCAASLRAIVNGPEAAPY
jgi:hypothetical protein